LLAKGRLMRVRPRPFFPFLQVIEFRPPLVETAPCYPQFLRQLPNVVGAPHALHSHPLKLPCVSLPLHFAVLPLQLCPSQLSHFKGAVQSRGTGVKREYTDEHESEDVEGIPAGAANLAASRWLDVSTLESGNAIRFPIARFRKP